MGITAWPGGLVARSLLSGSCSSYPVAVRCGYTNNFRACQNLDEPVPTRSVSDMTTTAQPESDDMTHVLMRFARCTHVMTAEYHTDEHGMPYVLNIVGGKHSGIVIHCQTELSVVRLFNEVAALHDLGIDHPYLREV